MSETGLLLQSKHKFEIDTTPTGGTPTYVTLAAGLNNFEPDNNEEVKQDTYLDGNGFATSTVTGAQLIIKFAGHRKTGDVAQDYIFTNLLELGKSRETTLRWTLPDGAKFEGPCTIANIKGPSGDANSKGEIGFELHFNGKPTYTAAV